jgi:hypothetical protein
MRSDNLHGSVRAGNKRMGDNTCKIRNRKSNGKLSLPLNVNSIIICLRKLNCSKATSNLCIFVVFALAKVTKMTQWRRLKDVGRACRVRG